MTATDATQKKLAAFVSRIENLEQDKANIAADIRDVFAEAKSDGFDVKAIRAVLKIRKMNDADRQEQEAILATYLHALGMAEDA